MVQETNIPQKQNIPVKKKKRTKHKTFIDLLSKAEKKKLDALKLWSNHQK